MRKVILSSILVSLFAPIIVFAAFTPQSLAEYDVPTVLNNIVNWLFSLLLIVAAIFIIVAAYNFVTAQGDADKIQTARTFVLYALIGVLVAFCAKGLVILVRMVVTTGA